MSPKDVLSQVICKTGLVSLNKLHKCMKKKIILGNCYLNNSFYTFDPGDLDL